MNATFHRVLFRNTLFALLLLILAGGAMGGALYAWRIARAAVNLRTLSLSAAIAAGLLAALFLALAMRTLDAPMNGFIPPWYIRWPLKINKRIVLLVQIIATALAVASAFFLAFHYPIPAV